MADKKRQSLSPNTRSLTAAEDVPDEAHPLNDPNNSFTVLEMSQSPSHAALQGRARSKPHPPPTMEDVESLRGKASLARAQTQSIMNGLKLKVSGQANPFATFSYALFPLMDKCVPVDWKILVEDIDVQSQHIRCHELQEKDELSMLVSNFKEQHAKALILINTQNNYSIAPQFLEGMEKSNFPIVVLTRSDGDALLSSLEQFEEDILARLDAESDVDIVIEQPVKAKQSPAAVRKKNDKEGPGVKQRIKAAFGYKTSTGAVNLKTEFKKLMFTPDNHNIPVTISDDQAKFTMMMATMSNYEKQAKEDNNHSDVNDALKRIKPHIEELFVEDIPLYIAVAYRLHWRTELYICDEMRTFIPTCLDKIENLKYRRLAQVFNDFLKRGDFQVMCGIKQEEESVSMFWLLESACLELAEISFKVKNQASVQQINHQGPANTRPLYPKFCYSRMMWMSMALRFHSARALPTRQTARVWYDRFINYHPRIILTDSVLREIVEGLDFGKLIALPEEVKFSSQNMTDLVMSERCIRPFKHLRHFVRYMEPFLEKEDDIFTMLTQIRATYTSKMNEPGFSMFSVSIEGTIADTITEGISLLDSLVVIWTQRQFREEAIDSECVNWLQLLLGLVDITGDHPDTLLKKFFGRSGVCKKYRKMIVKYVINTTHKNLDRLSIQQFFTLYKAFMIWPNRFLEEYINNYTVPANTKINDGTCKEFFSEVVVRFPEAHEHYYLLDFIIKISERYTVDGCATNFVLDLLRLDIPKLFATPGETVDSVNVEQAMEIRRNFSKILRNYIHGNGLKLTILKQMTEILNAISDGRDEFQQLILGVLHQEVIPEFKALQELESNSGVTGRNFRAVLKYSIDYLRKDLGWLQALSAKQAFCWGLVTSCCQRVRVTSDHFEWLHNYKYVVSELGKIFNTYCTGRRLSENESVIIGHIPVDIERSPSADVKWYFEWIQVIQTVIQSWKKKLEIDESANYDDILMYASENVELNKLCQTLCSTTLIVDFGHVQGIKNQFLSDFETLNVYLLRYIPPNTDSKWCSFIVLLRDYGVSLPRDLLSSIQKYVVFPDDKVHTKEELLRQPIPAGSNGIFQPGPDISLRLTRNVTLKALSSLARGLEEFSEPLTPHMEMLIFFKLYQSDMFDKYLRSEIEQASEAEKAKEEPIFSMPSTGLSLFKFSAPMHSVLQTAPKPKPGSGVTVTALVVSLQRTNDLLMKIMRGEASYAEINAKGKLDLEKLDIEREFTTLKNYATTGNIQLASFEGLSGVRSLLELFQYTKHVQNICDVCEQYQLQGCLEDEELKEVKSFVDDVRLEDNRSKLTPNEASQRMKRVKELLCIVPNASSNRLEIFPSVANSAEFYQFIRDKHFYGEKGQATFRQQYQLITAQLQHEEYDESVLNHLLAAFKVMTPFMNNKQTFRELMTKVTGLDTTVGLKQLETVNANITLIRLWFSRAEGDTLQNVAKELDRILETGQCTFTLPIEGEALLTLEYVHSSNQGPSLEEGVDGATNGPFSGIRTFPSKGEPKSGELEAGITKAPKLEQWNSEQIGDFVRKLGFMDTEKEGGDKIKHFRHISGIAYRLLELYSQLKDLGNPLYFKGTVEPLPCGIDRNNADERVRETEYTLESWRKRVTELRSEYDWLLFFSIPKILRLYNLLSASDMEETERLDKIICEISFLCKNDQLTRNNLKRHIEMGLESSKRDSFGEQPPMHVVGRFLGALFNSHLLPRRADSSPLLRARSLTSFSLSHEFTQLLHYCPAYTQGQLIQTVIGICSGVPEAFEVFHCRPTTTEGELSLFLKKAARHSLRSIVLEVNRLPFKLQEGLMQLHLLVQATQGKEENPSEFTTLAAARASPCIHFIETEPSVLRDVPWIQLREHKEPSVSFEDAQKVCRNRVLIPEDFLCIQLVTGAAGDGKTHYIKEQLQSSAAQLTIAVNEAFTPLKAITKLCTLPVNQKRAAIFFNFTMLGPGDSVDGSECERYNKLMEMIGWFFFDLLILGYVEDPASGKSFRIPGGLEWAIYVEVPSREREMSSGEALKQFRAEVPTLGLLGKQHCVRSEKPYTVDSDVQLVCKYLHAYKKGGQKGIDRLYKDGTKLVKFSDDPDLSVDECQRLLHEYMPDHIRGTKITQRLFVKYMKRRCEFLDNLAGFNYNTGGGEYYKDEQGRRVLTNTQHLGSTLMKTMLKEVRDFCDPAIKDNWSLEPHQQLIYDYKDCGASFGLISLHPEKLPEQEKIIFKRIGIRIPSMADLFSRDVLDGLLSRAFNIQLENNRLTAIDDSAYVLTLDYTIKMLNINERYECGVPVIIEGETGVGKTALIEMLSKLWNQSLLLEWKKQRDRVVEFFQRKIGDLIAGNKTEVSGNCESCMSTVQSMSGGQYVTEDKLVLLCQLQDGSTQLFSEAQSYLSPMRNDPVMAQLTLEGTKCPNDVTLEQLFAEAQESHTPQATARLLHAVLCAQIKPTFHKINVHAAMTPTDIAEHFKPVFDQAREIRDAYNKCKERAERVNSGEDETDFVSIGGPRRASLGRKGGVLSSVVNTAMLAVPGMAAAAEEKPEKKCFAHRMPFVTVFLDEVNTSSCVGLFKEIIVDRTFDGEPIPENVFIVAACNPHRGNSMASLGVQGSSEKDKEKWVRGTYYVRRLHPTLKFLMWDYGSLDEHQEREYITAKMKMLNNTMPNPEVLCLTDLIVGSQERMRRYAYQQIKAQMQGTVASVEYFSKISSRSCVSQRDIQRVFTLYQWFMKIYEKLKPHGDRRDYNRRAVLVSLGIVYYMRLNNYYRQEYKNYLDNDKSLSRLPYEVTFTQAFNEELDWYIDLVELPKGIARTRALKENIFATIVCTVNHIPLIIVGAPGSSKTLSFNQTIANLKGAESRVKTFRDTTIFHSLDPHYYQCSRRTTSNEIQTVFSRAINRQRSHAKFNLPIYCVVFMDEAGLPEESHESLKVLHYHLDKQEVSFVAITNHVLDAAKTNRAVSLFRPEASDDDLHTLAKGCFCSDPENPPTELKDDLKRVVAFCNPYSTLMESKTFARFFGLRDFIQFVNYLRRKRDDNQSLTPQVVMQALERNFNGDETFDAICYKFLGANLQKVKQRGILEILRSSLMDRPQEKQDMSENEVRYKLIIDPSEDDSLVRLLFTFGILKRENTRIFVCSNFPADGQIQKINTIAAIRHSAIEGHTVVMSQTDDIHESFYDLFNQRFRRIDDLKEGPRYYTNIAIGAHLRPSRVHPNFQCVVVVKKSEIMNTPSPFLNRFEKYLITHETMLQTALEGMPPSVAAVISAAMDKVKDFISLVSGSDSLYGLCNDTLNSLVLSLLPSVDHAYVEIGELSLVDNSRDIKFYMLQEIVQALREGTGIFIPKYTEEEFELDVDSVFDLILTDPKFKGQMQSMNHMVAAQAIPEAFNVLHSKIAPGEHMDVSPEGCLVIALLQQWLVRHLCKRLMQLMTSEALILHRNKIPFSYLKNYLNFHYHFSLLNLVENHHQAVESTRRDPPTCRSATKILCFTRSSPLIHQLPAKYPSKSLGDKMGTRAQEVLENFVFVETNKLVTYKLSSIPSQTTVHDLIRSFLDSETAEVCLLVINMQETSKEIVNHVRIMIEEAETLSTKQDMTKMFVVLLHFPPAQFFKPCYPSLFLKGWDHCYLDTIAHSTVKGVVDIRDWFWQCCFPQQSSQLEEDTLLQALLALLPQAIPVLASRVFFGSKQNSSFNCTMSGFERTQALNTLLFKKGQNDNTVGRILCEKFRAYWKPAVMAEQLEKAAVFSKNRESTLNITESIQTNFKSLFFDFLVYMVSRINEDYNIDIIFDENCPDSIQQLFLEILRVFPTSKLSQVTLLSNNLLQLQRLVYTPKFPFFKMVCEILEKVLEQSREDANVKLDILSEITAPPESSLDLSVRSVMTPQDILGTLQKAVTDRISEKMEGTTNKQILMLVADAMSSHVELWNKYFNDFVLHKLRLDAVDSTGGIAQQILHTFMGQLHHLRALERVVSLHAYLHVYQLDLAKMASVLRPLNKLHKLHKDTATQSTILTPVSPTSPSHKLLSIVEQTQHPFGSPQHLATFVVTTLFDAVVGFLYPNEGSVIDVNKNMKVWHSVFRDVMTLPNLKTHIYSALGGHEREMTTVEAKLNLMQTTFLTFQISPDIEKDTDIVVKGQYVFRTLYARHFDDVMELKTECPRLSAVVQVSLEVISPTGMSVNSNPLDSVYIDSSRVIIEGLFAHFFSSERQCYHPEDIRWFMRLANAQKEWGSRKLEYMCGVLSADLSEDLSCQVEDSWTNCSEMPEGTVCMNVFKLYLGKILGQCDAHSDKSTNVDSGPLQLYYQFPRSEIGLVLTAKPELGPPGPFIPKFYKECSFIKIDSGHEHPTMQQPLAHLYFYTVLEHLMSKPYKLSGLVRIASNINSLCCLQPTSDADKAVLFIELQAVTQVIAQQLALHLNPAEPEKMGEVVSIYRELNQLMDNEATGGGGEGGYGMVVALHLLKLLKSSRRFIDLFMQKYDSVLRGINCLAPFNDQLKKKDVSCAHLLPFMMPTAEGDMATLYNQVHKVMLTIHNKGGQPDSLKNLAEECAHWTKKRQSVSKADRSSGKPMDKRDSFRMMVWLVAYYEFFDKKVKSQILCNVVGSEIIAPYLKEEGYIRMIQCFLCPELMIHRKEAPNVLREDQAVIELTPDGRHRPIRRRGNEMDPIFELFQPKHPEQQDQSDADLRHSLANLVAMVMGCPSRSNHLWYHMYAPEELVNSYMTGFMYNSKISPEGLLYDCGVELTAQGEYGRSDYLKHAGRGTYTLHSLYLLLWTNFGAFTMALLTQPDADARIHGSLISEWQSIRHYCVSQLRTVWQHMRNNLGLSEEERTFFVNRCLKTFHEVVNSPHEALLSPQLLESGDLVKDCVRGVFTTRGELDDYERLWHCRVYQPTRAQLQDKFAEYSDLWQNQLFAKLRCLEVHYPHFPSEADFIHRILSYGDLEQHSEGGELRGLSQFAQSWRRLQAGGLLLQDLVEFYRWLHTELSHLVTYERTTTLPIYRVVKLAAKRYGSPMGEYILALYDRVKRGYNSYVEMIGGAIGAGACAALKQGNRIYTIADDVPILHFLTDSEQEEEGNDWLFTVIADIVGAHNLAIETLYTVIHSQDQFHLSRLLPDQPAKVLPTEVNEKNCIIGNFTSLHGVNSLLQVLRSRYCPPTLKSSHMITQGPSMSFSPLQTKYLPEFQLRHLEEDLVRLFNAGKPLIESPSSIRIMFKFKQSSKRSIAVPDDVIRATMDLEEIGFRLPDDYKESLPTNLNKHMEYEFHSCGYNSMVEIITALRTVCGHLVKVIMEDTHLLNEDEEDLDTLTLPEFMMAYVYEHLDDPQRVLAEIGITPNSLKHSQLACLIDLPLPSVFACFQLFVQWVDQGVYDFYNLPLALKAHLCEADLRFLDLELREQWSGSVSSLEGEVKQMIEVLKHSEGDITKRVNEHAPSTSILDYLTSFLLLEDTDKLPPLIPKTIVLQHYVHFRLALRRLLIRLRAELASEASGNEERANQWSEFVADLWSSRLRHLREETYGEGDFMFDPSTGRYGFEDESDDGSEEGLMRDLENDQYGEGPEDEDLDNGGFTVDLNALAEEDSFAEVVESMSQAKVTHSYDLGQLSDEESDLEELELGDEVPKGVDESLKQQPSQPDEPSEDVLELKSRLKHDPDFQKTVMSMAQTIMKRDEEVLAPKAREYTPQDVADFFASIKLEKYAQAFLEGEISGDVLLDADSEFLKELGVESPLDCVRIMTMFPRRLEESEAMIPVSEVLKFLKLNKMEKYVDHFEQNQIDGDMLLNTDQALMKNVLKEIGIGVVDRVKIISKFKTFVSTGSIS